MGEINLRKNRKLDSGCSSSATCGRKGSMDPWPGILATLTILLLGGLREERTDRRGGEF